MYPHEGDFGEKKGPKEASVALSGFESKDNRMVAANNFLRVAYFHGCFVRALVHRIVW